MMLLLFLFDVFVLQQHLLDVLSLIFEFKMTKQKKLD